MSPSLREEMGLSEPADARRAAPEHPQGWEPGIAWTGREGTITSRPLAEPSPDWDALLRVWGFDPAVVEVVEPVQVRTWDAAIGDGIVRTMWYYRAGLRQRRKGGPSIEELLTLVKRSRPAKATEVGTDINSLKRDMAFIKGATKIAAMVVTIGVPALIAAIGWFLK